ncbi:MAG: ABC transporter substrate-binding protein [Chloroflexi bacterium]|nr:ABC transporter substrate-binding protein [Chloroflexota bacterium]
MIRRHSRRAVLLAAGAGSLALACTSAAPPSAAAAAQPKRGGRLRAAIRGGDAPVVDGHRISQTILESVFMAHDTLTEYDQRSVPQPALAESWDLSTDGKRLRLNLRPGVEFHSGRPFTSEDVRWNLLRVRDPKVGVAQLATQSAWFTGLETPDARTVVLTLDRVRPALFDFFETFNILDRDTVEGPHASTRAVGTGAFSLAEYVPSSRMRFVRNPRYWRGGRPYLDEVEITLPSDAQAAVAQLESGAIDTLSAPPVRDLVRLRANAAYRVVRNEQSGTHSLWSVNTRAPGLGDKRVRRALSHAIDRARLAKSVLLETEDWRVLPWATTSPAFEADRAKGVTFDLERSRALLRDAGASDLRLSFTYGTTDAETQSLAEIVQADLAKIGVTLTLQRVEAAAFADLTSASRLAYQGIAGGGLFSRGGRLEPVSLLTSSSWYLPAGNRAGFVSDRYRALVEAAGVEPDAAKRRDTYRQLNELLLDESWALTLATSSAQVLARSKVRDVSWRASDALRYADIWMD